MVEVIQFRNSFDSQGPGVPGLIPSEAVRRLRLFHDQYHQLDHRRKVLDAVQVVFGIAPTPFPELDKTGEVIHGITTLIRLTSQPVFWIQTRRYISNHVKYLRFYEIKMHVIQIAYWYTEYCGIDAASFVYHI